MAIRTHLVNSIAFLVIICANAQACSVFMLSGTSAAIVGRNYDWDTGTGLLMANKRGLKKTALSTSNPKTWVSKYGSLTFNQYGREFPCGGMNEEGLIIEVLWLEGSKYPMPDDRPMVSTLQWVQYQLDTAKTVDDVIGSDKDVRIQSISGTQVHFFVADRQGNAATIEFIDGKMVAHSGDDLPVTALTNSTYKRSMKRFRRTPESERSKCNGSSLERFTCAGHMASNCVSNQNAEQHCFRILDTVKQGSFTKWSIVYDAKKLRIAFRTRDASRVRYIEFAQLDFSNVTPMLVLDLSEDIEGNLREEMVHYTAELNEAVLAKSMSETPVFSELPKFLTETVAKFPESVTPANAEEATAQ